MDISTPLYGHVFFFGEINAIFVFRRKIPLSCIELNTRKIHLYHFTIFLPLFSAIFYHQISILLFFWVLMEIIVVLLPAQSSPFSAKNQFTFRFAENPTKNVRLPGFNLRKISSLICSDKIVIRSPFFRSVLIRRLYWLS